MRLEKSAGMMAKNELDLNWFQKKICSETRKGRSDRMASAVSSQGFNTVHFSRQLFYIHPSAPDTLFFFLSFSDGTASDGKIISLDMIT